MFEEIIPALKNSGYDVITAENKSQALTETLKLIPKNSEVMTMSSISLEQSGISKEINDSRDFKSVKNILSSLDRNTDGQRMKQIGSAPQIAIGSVHALTKEGHLVIASNTGSQLPAYSYGASKVIFVVGRQKIVSNLDEAFKRVYDYVLPLESKRVQSAYGMKSSNVSKLLIINKEIVPHRITIILVNEDLGY